MLKKKFFIPLAALSLLISTVAACNGGNKTSEPAGSSSEEPKTSEPAPSSESSVAPSSEAPSSSSSEAPHEHDYEAVGTAVKNADGKDVFLKECKSHDDKYIGIAFADFSSHSDDFDGKLTQEGQYGSVPEEIKSSGFLLKKNSTVTWKINVDKAITGAKLYFGCTMTSSSHSVQKGDENGTVKYSVKVNNGDMVDWAVSGDTTYADVGLENTTDRVYVNFATVNLVAGENSIVLSQNNAGYRLIFGGEVRLHYTGDAKPVAAPEGYTVTFVPGEHAKVLVYESGSDYTQNPVETNTTKARTSDGQIAEYAEANETTGAGKVKPQVNFQVVLDEGYVFDDGIDHTFTHQEGDPENIKESPEVEAKNISWVSPEANFNKAKIIEYTNGDKVTLIYRLTKIKGNLTVTINPVKLIAQPSNTFSGIVTVSGQGVFTTIALANSKAFVELGTTKATVDYTFDNKTGLVTIPLGGNYGNLKGTYDPENNKLTKCGLDGAAAAAVTSNGELEFTGALKHFDCEGTDAELQTVFKRRVGSNETGVVTADTTNFIAGKSGVQLPGNSGGDVRLNLKQDIANGVTAKNLGYWVYNPSTSNVKLRMWVYKAANLGSNAEVASSSGVEFAPGWSYYRIGFTEAKIFNIQIGDFAKSGVNLTFDNIAIF